MSEDNLEELTKELAKQRKIEDNFVCDVCQLCFDSQEELELHFWNAHREYLEEVESKAEELSENEEIKRGIEEYKENLKKKILLEATPRQVKAYEQNPEALKERIRKEMLMSSLKGKTDSANESQLLLAIKTRAKEEIEQALSLKYCKICNDFYPEGLRKHLEQQASLGSKEHEEYLRYLDIMTTEDMERIKTYYEGYPKYQYPYEEKYPYVCPICSKRFETKEAFKVHWASEHQMKYGTYPEFAKEKESLSSEDKRKKELIFIAESLLRKRKKD
jgi:hypothetical protein